MKFVFGISQTKVGAKAKSVPLRLMYPIWTHRWQVQAKIEIEETCAQPCT